LKGFRLRYSTKRSKALARFAHRTDRWINLTGTPSPKGLTDLWGPQWFVDGGAALGRSYTDFENRWFYRQARGRTQYQEIKAHDWAQQDIENRLRKTTLSIRAKDWFDIKEPIENIVWVELPPAVRTQYKQMERHFYSEFERGAVTAANCAVKVTKLLQIVSGAVYHGDGAASWVHDAKIEGLKSIVEETAGANLLVVYQFVSELNRLVHAFPKAVDIRDAGAIEQWNAGDVRMLLCHPASAGHGLNLQDGGHHIVYFTPTWDLELYAQVLERIGPVRQMQSGYDRPVYVHHILARATVDTLVKTRREGKATLMELLLDALRGETHESADTL
jgi:SNF2 family DNA or RNA helicase